MSRASIAVAAFSTVVEWYDFTLYLYFATVLSRVFFGAGETAVSTTLAAFAIAYLLRPLGGVVFGHIGDRFGRRRTMLLSVALMTMTMLGTALLPTHAQAGAAAGWLLFLLRCLMGFSVGGEYIAIVAYLLEGSPRTQARLDHVVGLRVQRGRGAARRRRLLADRQFAEPRKLGVCGDGASPFSSAPFWPQAYGSHARQWKNCRTSKGNRRAGRRPRARCFTRS